MRNNYRSDAERLDRAISRFEATIGQLPGLASDAHREVLIEQIIDSERRVAYTDQLLSRVLDPVSADPRSTAFDPLRAAILHARSGSLDEAAWLVFLFVHFGKHRETGWRYIRYVYGAFGAEPHEWWTWERTAADPTQFRFWLDEHQDDFHTEPGRHGFGNHHKYGSLKAWTDNGTGAAVQSYVDWVLSAGGDHQTRFDSLMQSTPEESFDAIYVALDSVVQFGRIARFDYLTMLSKLALIDIFPPHSYLIGATGPLRGAQLLLRGEVGKGSARELQAELSELGTIAGIRPDVLEDAVCNWQKYPARYVRFSA